MYGKHMYVYIPVYMYMYTYVAGSNRQEINNIKIDCSLIRLLLLSYWNSTHVN